LSHDENKAVPAIRTAIMILYVVKGFTAVIPS